VTLRLRLLLVLVGIVAAGLLVSDIVTYSQLQSFLVKRLNQQLQAAPDPVARALQECIQQEASPFTPNSGSCNLPFSLTSQVPSGAYGQLRDAQRGQVLAWTCFQRPGGGHAARRTPGLPSPLPYSSGTRKATIFNVTKTGCGAQSYEGVAALTGNLLGSPDNLVVVVAVPLTDVNQTLDRLLFVEGLVSLGVLVGLGALSWWIVRRGLKPLDEMATTAGAIASGDLSQRVTHTEAHTEVGRLGVALNTMLSEIEGAFAARAASEERLRRFLADASHELRTPLTSIRGYSEIFDRGARDRPEDLATSMRHIRSEANRMSELVDDLLLLARLDHERPLAHEQVDLTAVASAAVDAARVKAPDRVVAFDPAAPVVVPGDANRLRQVADNLLANAINHTPDGTPIDVNVRADGDVAVLTVADQGPGIAPADRDHIFEPFHRADPSRARATGGVGLGLAIVSAIAAAHGGTVGVDSEPGAGAAFWVRLPQARTDIAPPVSPLDPPPATAPPPQGPPVSPAPPPPVPPNGSPVVAPPSVPSVGGDAP
jgi:two-component system OmpR family sensor kinase